MGSPHTIRPPFQSGVNVQPWASKYLPPLCYRDEMSPSLDASLWSS